MNNENEERIPTKDLGDFLTKELELEDVESSPIREYSFLDIDKMLEVPKNKSDELNKIVRILSMWRNMPIATFSNSSGGIWTGGFVRIEWSSIDEWISLEENQVVTGHDKRCDEDYEIYPKTLIDFIEEYDPERKYEFYKI